MPTTTAKRGPGRPPAKKTAPKKESPKTVIKRDISPVKAYEYKTLRPMGATYMMQQKGVTVFDPETEMVREIRYCPNENSIWRDDQSPSARRESIVFIEGRHFVSPEKPNLKAFLDTHPGNKKNGGKIFELVDKTQKAKVEVDNEFLVADAVTMIRDKDLDQLLSVAVALGMNIDRQVSEIKHDLLVFAKKNPKSFIESFDNPSVEMKTKISMAAKYQVIKLEKDGVRWFDSNNLIVSVPEGKDPLDVFVRYCLTEAAVPVVEEMERQMN